GTMLMSGIAAAADLSIVSGATGNDLAFMQKQHDKFAADTGNSPMRPMRATPWPKPMAFGWS
ncbi:MAG: hypothetical protein ACKOVA_02590, partial [Novosphingobium sp.]